MSGFRVQGSGLGVPDLGTPLNVFGWVSGLGFLVWGCGLGVWGSMRGAGGGKRPGQHDGRWQHAWIAR